MNSGSEDAPVDQELGISQQAQNLNIAKGENNNDENDENEVPSASQSQPQDSQRHCCFSRYFGYNKRTLAVISLLFLVIAVMTTTITTSKAYSSTLNKNWILVGGITESSAVFRIRTDSDESQAQTLVVSSSDNDTVLTRNVTYSDFVATLNVDGLASNTRYPYQTLSETGAVVSSGSFTTAPPLNTRYNFTIATAGCTWTGSTSKVFSHVQEMNPLLFLHLGDFHYLDIDSTNVETRIEAMDQVLSSPSQQALFQSTSLSIMWDDHDYLGNDSQGYEEGREAALTSYTLGFPHYMPLPASQLNTTTADMAVPPYHAFTIATVRFIISDLRSESTAESIYSEQQKEWLYEELRNSTQYDFVVWVSTKPWIGPVKPEDDSWSGQSQDRAELSDFISREVTKQNLLAISADAHMVAFDNGSNTYYGTDNSSTSSFPLLQSGPLDRLGSTKGGPFSDGCYTVKYERNHQFSTLDFEFDEEGEACIQVTSYRISGTSRNVILSKRLCGEIFGSSENEGSGSCESPTLSTGSIALVSISGVMAICGIMSVCYFFTRCEATKIAVMVTVAFFITLVAGFGIPLAMGVSQYSTFAVLMVLLIQMIFTLVFIVVWSLKKRAGKM